MSNSKYQVLRLPANTWDRVKAVADQYQGISAVALVDMIVTQVLDMMDQPPSERSVPHVVHMVDTARSVRRGPVRFEEPAPPLTVAATPRGVPVKGVRG